MAGRLRKDGRWEVYYRDPKTGRRRSEYFGRGTEGRTAAYNRNDELGLGRGRRSKRQQVVSFGELAKTYLQSKHFSEKSRRELKGGMEAHILPVFGNRPAMAITDQDLDNYIRTRRSQKNRNYKDKKKAPTVKASTVNREITDIKGILNFAVKRKPPLIPWNPVRDYQKPADDYDVILPPSAEKTEKILALSIDKETIGEAHPDYATDLLHNLAGVIRAQGRYSEAEELYRQALDISLAALGRDHPTTKTCEDNLKSLLEKMKKGFSEK
ncbi:MAG: tetratricopeptide repeat protein [Desulfobacterales bacterium]|nr:tetratricopeptide repeat protein [Desulfobacterales bacterium]